ncbi:major facilitator superfamily-domain-containing protein [Dendryphion nanum]|uniref:Major facilitator superfamily-domain-containing protein n=1 Tax=Dendryphion nanum TaxID=256645 RepID=A0A9P9E3X3_9PLEO|nr:major facilitator superfamily-domain-containing protein [Dendryphion nanum]
MDSANSMESPPKYEASITPKDLEFEFNLFKTQLDSPTSQASPKSPIQTPFTSLEKIDNELRAFVVVETLPAWSPTRQEWFIMVSLSIISLMVALDTTILVGVLPSMAADLGGSSVDTFWTGTSYLLTSAVFQPVIASISETLGRQQLLLFSLFLFTIGSAMCGFAPSFQVMLGGRCIQGVGGGGIITLTQVIFCDIVPLRQRPTYFAMVLGTWSIGTILGPVIGGLITENTSWRWVFWINFPFCGLGLILAIVFVKLNSMAKLTLIEKLKRTDWIGAVLFIGGVTSALIGISWAGTQYSWTSPQVLVPLIIGLVTVVAFVFWERHVAPHSLLPISIFYCSSALAAFYCAFANGLVLLVALYYFPFYAMSVRGATAIKAGIDFFPCLFLCLPGSVMVAALTTRLGRFRWAIWIGWVIITIGSGLFILFDTNLKKPVMIAAQAVLGIGVGMVLTSVNVGVQAISKEEDSAMSASMYGFMRSLGMPVGIALGGTIFQNAMSAKLDSFHMPTSIAHDSESYVYELRRMTDGIEKTNILESYAHGFRGVFIFMTAVAGSGLLASLFIKKFNMNKALVSKYSART